MSGKFDDEETIKLQDYYPKTREERNEQFASPWDRQNLYRNLFHVADDGRTVAGQMFFWQFILYFYSFCLKQTGNMSFIDQEDDNTLDLLCEFAKFIHADDFEPQYDQGDHMNDGFDFRHNFSFTFGKESDDSDAEVKIPDKTFDKLMKTLEEAKNKADPKNKN